MIDRNTALDILKTYKKEFSKKYGIESLGIFGSVAKNSANQSSDVDIVIKMKKSNLFVLSGIRIDLEELFQRHVDLIQYRGRMNTFLKNRIDQEAHYV
jgi:uncharacterized protein